MNRMTAWTARLRLCRNWPVQVAGGYLTIATLFSQPGKDEKVRTCELLKISEKGENMELYNVRIYYYETGTQYRIYSRPVSKLSEEEKADKKRFEEIHGKTHKHKKLVVKNLEYCPFTDDMEEIGSIDDAQRATQVSLNRSKQQLVGICRANKWSHFLTFTFNPRLVDSTNYEEVCIKAGQFMNNLRKRTCPDMKYVLVPELHKNGGKYHLHGLIADCEGFQMRVSGKEKAGHIIYNIPSWKYGWNTATEVEHTGKVSNYIAKYITKDTNGLLHGKHRYWCSQNTIRPKDVCDELYIPDYMSVIEHLSSNDAIKHLKKSHILACNMDIWYIET